MQMLVYVTSDEVTDTVKTMSQFFRVVFEPKDFSLEALRAFTTSPRDACFVLTEKHASGFRVGNDVAIMFSMKFKSNRKAVSQARSRIWRSSDEAASFEKTIEL